MRKQFSNKEILDYATALSKEILENAKDVELPTKVNFYLQKNIKTFLTAAQDIEEAQLKIGKKYGEYNSEKEAYIITDSEKLSIAQKEMEDLLSVDQVLEVYFITLADLQDTKLTIAQMNAMLFMIDEQIEEEKVLW